MSYNLVDQVTAITQGTTTSFTYDSLGRSVNETNGGLTTFRHYTDSSDNPEWTSQLEGNLLTTEIYTDSLGAGLGVTTNIKGTTKTQTMQLRDLKGHTVTTLNLSTNSVSSWSTYDSFGNPQTSQTTTNLINYSSYGQQERATNNTGLILMGARVYNPKTNQFTSKDPIQGGNENPYTYPNDPVNSWDTAGLLMLSQAALDLVAGLMSFMISATALAICIGLAVSCLVASLFATAFSNILKQNLDMKYGPKSKNKSSQLDFTDFFIDMISSFAWAGLSSVIKAFLKPILKQQEHYFAEILAGEIAIPMLSRAGNGLVRDRGYRAQAYNSYLSYQSKPHF